MTGPFFIIDFDNTFIKGESLEIVAEVALRKTPGKDKILSTMSGLVDESMAGRLSFSDSLRKRFSFLELHRDHLTKAIELIKERVTESFWKHKSFFKQHRESIYVVSGGFRELILPVTRMFELRDDHVFANEFIFNFDGQILGIDEKNPLAHDMGKAKLVKTLGLGREGIVLGDGMTDYEIVVENPQCRFFAFNEHVTRDEVVKKAERTFGTLDQVLDHLGLIKASSVAVNRVLLLENIHPLAIRDIRSKGFFVETLPGALDEEDLIQKLKDVQFLGIRSKTQVTERALESAKHLVGVGAFCIGTDQIDLNAATRRGVAVFNAPFSNTRSVVELTLASIVMLSRQVFEKSLKLHKGIWDKSAEGSCEVRGKTLGIVGYGNIGSQLSVLAENMGMKVLYYDIVEKLPLGNAHSCSDLKTLLEESDFISIHVDGRAGNFNLIDESCFKLMKDRSILLNLSRGFVVDLKALAKNLRNGKIAGAALDVFPHEPKSKDEVFHSELQNMRNVILTPHIGGSTIEAQRNIGEFVSARLLDYYEKGISMGSVNLPQLQISERKGEKRILHIHENVPGILAQVNGILGSHGINIEAQYLGTNDLIGYVVTDVDKFQPECEKEIRQIPHTIRLRVVS
ncbi:MAG: phosphoglycerate dehydrogenase [Deltaproteobacteria bacterium]|nr:phosphoglycerate dehydrogenase [Deltaproteobacteria bacterium]